MIARSITDMKLIIIIDEINSSDRWFDNDRGQVSDFVDELAERYDFCAISLNGLNV
jgi:hypothetical protein